MKIKFPCTQCGIKLEIDAAASGSAIACPHCEESLIVPAAEIGEGTTLGGFRIESLLGKGGMGEVYLARQISLDRAVALKILPAELRRDQELMERFLQEVRSLARLEHPHIVAAYEAGDDNGVLYLAMAYVAGASLEDRLKREGRIPWKDACAIVKKLAGALAYAWDEHRMLHRDIKPSNVLMDSRGEPKLVDLGLAKSLAQPEGQTLSGTIMGTPNYMSPEQAEGRDDLDARADMYSLGATLYNMLTGQTPFQGSSLMDTLQKRVTELLPDPRQYAPEVPEGLVVLLEIMLAKDPTGRHADWASLIVDVQQVLSHRKPRQKPPEPGGSTLERGLKKVLPRSGPLAAAGSPATPAEAMPAADPPKKRAHPLVAAGLTFIVMLALWWRSPRGRLAVIGLAAAVVMLGVGLWQVVKPAPSVPAMRPEKVRNSNEFRSGTGAERVNVPVSPGSPAPAPVVPADARSAEVIKAVDVILEFEKSNPAEYGEMLLRLEKLAQETMGPKDAERVGQEIERVRATRQEAVDRALATLRTAIEAQAAAGQFATAERAALDYTGAFAAETVAERAKLVGWVKDQAAERAAAEQRAAAQAAQAEAARVAALRARLAELLDDAAEDILSQNPMGAAMRLRRACADATWATVSNEIAVAIRFVEGLGEMPKLILKSFDVQKGQTVRLELCNGMVESWTIGGTEEGQVWVRQTVGKGEMARQLALTELSPRERQQRLGDDKRADVHVMRGLLALEKRDSAEAAALFAKARALEAKGNTPSTGSGQAGILTNSAPREGSGIGDNSGVGSGVIAALVRAAEKSLATGTKPKPVKAEPMSQVAPPPPEVVPPPAKMELVNVALNAKADANRCYAAANGPEKVNDGVTNDAASYWFAGTENPRPDWVGLEFETPVKVHSIRILIPSRKSGGNEEYILSDYRVVGLNQGMKTILDSVKNGKHSKTRPGPIEDTRWVVVDLRVPKVLDGMQLVCLETAGANSGPVVYEIEVIGAAKAK